MGHIEDKLDWSNALERFSQCVDFCIDVFNEITYWTYQNPYLVMIFTMSIMIIVFELIKKAKDGVD